MSEKEVLQTTNGRSKQKQEHIINGCDNFFQFPNIFIGCLVLFGLFVLTMAEFWPQQIPMSLGPIRNIAVYISQKYPALLSYIFLFTWVTHLVQAALMVKLCRAKHISRDATIKWCIQTAVVGFPSIIALLQYKSKVKRL